MRQVVRNFRRPVSVGHADDRHLSGRHHSWYHNNTARRYALAPSVVRAQHLEGVVCCRRQAEEDSERDNTCIAVNCLLPGNLLN